jgi:hypothetical protein
MRSWRQSWVYAAVLAGLLYAIVGITFAIPASNGRAWRLAAWAISIVLYTAQVVYEHFALRHSPRSAALHVAVAAALGAFGLAIGANLHSLLARPTEQTSIAPAHLTPCVASYYSGTCVSRGSCDHRRFLIRVTAAFRRQVSHRHSKHVDAGQAAA